MGIITDGMRVLLCEIINFAVFAQFSLLWGFLLSDVLKVEGKKIKVRKAPCGANYTT